MLQSIVPSAKEYPRTSLRQGFSAIYVASSHQREPRPGQPASFQFEYILTVVRQWSLLELHEKYGTLVRVGPNEVSISDFRLYRQIYNQNASEKDESFYAAASLLGYDNVFSMRYLHRNPQFLSLC